MLARVSMLMPNTQRYAIEEEKTKTQQNSLIVLITEQSDLH